MGIKVTDLSVHAQAQAKAQLAAERAAKRAAGGPKKLSTTPRARKPPTAPSAPHMSQGEALLETQLRLLGLPLGKSEYYFAKPDRNWRFDRAWPLKMVAVEIEGGTRGKSRHTEHEGFQEDCRKYAWATERGWRVFRYTTEMVANGEAINQLERLLTART